VNQPWRDAPERKQMTTKILAVVGVLFLLKFSPGFLVLIFISGFIWRLCDAWADNTPTDGRNGGSQTALPQKDSEQRRAA